MKLSLFLLIEMIITKIYLSKNSMKQHDVMVQSELLFNH